MKARINHGKRGRNINSLSKSYDFSSPAEFYDYIIESYIIGHKEQVIDLFNQMKAKNQQEFLYSFCYGEYAREVREFIISNLF